MDNQTIGQIICEHRKKKGLTQKALAEQLNITDKAVSKWERDIARPDINTVPQLAKILDVPVELLINIPLSSKDTTDSPVNPQSEPVTDLAPDPPAMHIDDEEQIIYKATVKRLLLKGLWGFLIGVLFVLITTLSDTESFNIGFALIIGLLLSGVPYGWELLSTIIGRWYVVGSIPVMLIVFMLKLTGAVFIGWVAYPIALLYALIKAHRKGSKLRTLFTILLIAFILIVVTFIALMFILPNRGNM